MGREDRISETALIVILNVYDRPLFREIRRQWLIGCPDEWDKLRNLKSRTLDSDEPESGSLVADVLLRFLHLGLELSDRLFDL